MEWKSILDLMYSVTPKELVAVVELPMSLAADTIGVPGSSGQSPTAEVSSLFAIAMEAAEGDPVAKTIIRNLRQVFAPRSNDLWNGGVGELTGNDQELLGL